MYSDANLLITPTSPRSPLTSPLLTGFAIASCCIRFRAWKGNVKQVIENHQKVSPKEYSGDKVAIPPPEELPHLDVQVVNYHVPLVGTFHSKFMVVDRNVALLMSNNIQVWFSG